MDFTICRSYILLKIYIYIIILYIIILLLYIIIIIIIIIIIFTENFANYEPCVKSFHIGHVKLDLQIGHDSKLVHSGKRYLHITGPCN